LIDSPLHGRPVPGIPDSIIAQAAKLPAHLPGGTALGASIEGRPGALLFEVPGTARYLIHDGTTIAFKSSPGSDPATVELFLNGSARGVLIHQRGELALEACTILAPNGQCVAISGNSGVGKSTLAAALCTRGWNLVAEDVTRVTWNGRQVLAWLSAEAIKLWRDACERLGLDCSGRDQVRRGMQKYILPMPVATQPVALMAVIRLSLGARGSPVGIEGPARLELLAQCTFRARFLEPLGRIGKHARMIRHADARCRIFALAGARDHLPEDLADSIERAVS
jgi:hypothetical protein